MGKDFVRVTKLDIDDNGWIVPLKEIELKLPANDQSVALILSSCTFAAIFTDRDSDNVILIANAITNEELEKEKKSTLERIHAKRKTSQV